MPLMFACPMTMIACGEAERAGRDPGDRSESAAVEVLHIADRDVWERAKSQGSYRPESLAAEGFIHCSTPGQLLGVANRFYTGRHGLVLLHIDPARLESPLRSESPPGSAERFPHIHGPLNLDAVVGVEPFEPGEDGTFGPPAGIGRVGPLDER